VEDRSVELIALMQMDNGGFKEGLIRAIFGPAMVPFVYIGVMEFVALGFELVPLNAGMEDIENVVKDFVERELGLGSFFGFFQMGINVPIKVFATDFSWNALIDERRGRGFELGIHRGILPDEGDQFEAPYFPYYLFILSYLGRNLTMTSFVMKFRPCIL